MSHFVFDHGEFKIDMLIKTDSTVRGEVYPKGERVNVINFSVGDAGALKGDTDYKLSFSIGSVTGKYVARFARQVDLAERYAKHLADKIAEFTASSERYVEDINNCGTERDLITYLALTPKTTDPEVIKKVLRSVVESRTLGDLTTTKDVKALSDTAFHGILNAALILGYDKPSAIDPNKRMAEFLREIGR